MLIFVCDFIHHFDRQLRHGCDVLVTGDNLRNGELARNVARRIAAAAKLERDIIIRGRWVLFEYSIEGVVARITAEFLVYGRT